MNIITGSIAQIVRWLDEASQILGCASEFDGRHLHEREPREACHADDAGDRRACAEQRRLPCRPATFPIPTTKNRASSARTITAALLPGTLDRPSGSRMPVKGSSSSREINPGRAPRSSSRLQLPA